MRIRTSSGLRISRTFGNFSSSPSDDIVFGILDSDKAISVQLEHTKSLEERGYAYIQSAVLYTTREGQRRVRVCNVAVQVAGLAGNVFRFADMDATVCHLLREGESPHGIPVNLVFLPLVFYHFANND